MDVEYTETFDVPDSGHLLWKLSEEEALKYVVQIWREGQEYDAGNAILFLIQTERLGVHAITQIVDLILDSNTPFQSKIGKILAPKVFRLLGNWLTSNRDPQRGKKLLAASCIWEGDLATIRNSLVTLLPGNEISP